jgi:putative oxidoreductase
VRFDRLRDASFLARLRHLGLFVLRFGVGIMFAMHGWPKLIGGPEKWTKLGGTMANLGIDVFPTFFGLMAGLSEFGGGLCFLLGLAFRPACAALAFTMFVATAHHLAAGDGIMGASHALEAMFVFVGMLAAGPGDWSLDHLLFGRRRNAAGTAVSSDT